MLPVGLLREPTTTVTVAHYRVADQGLCPPYCSAEMSVCADSHGSRR